MITVRKVSWVNQKAQPTRPAQYTTKSFSYYKLAKALAKLL